MPNLAVKLHINATNFTTIHNGTVSYGFRLHTEDGFVRHYENNLTQAESILPDLELFDLILCTHNCGIIAKLMLSVEYTQNSISINGNVYNWTNLQPIFQKYYGY